MAFCKAIKKLGRSVAKATRKMTCKMSLPSGKFTIPKPAGEQPKPTVDDNKPKGMNTSMAVQMRDLIKAQAQFNDNKKETPPKPARKPRKVEKPINDVLEESDKHAKEQAKKIIQAHIAAKKAPQEIIAEAGPDTPIPQPVRSTKPEDPVIINKQPAVFSAAKPPLSRPLRKQWGKQSVIAAPVQVIPMPEPKIKRERRKWGAPSAHPVYAVRPDTVELEPIGEPQKRYRRQFKPAVPRRANVAQEKQAKDKFSPYQRPDQKRRNNRARQFVPLDQLSTMKSCYLVNGDMVEIRKPWGRW